MKRRWVRVTLLGIALSVTGCTMQTSGIEKARVSKAVPCVALTTKKPSRQDTVESAKWMVETNAVITSICGAS